MKNVLQTSDYFAFISARQFRIHDANVGCSNHPSVIVPPDKKYSSYNNHIFPDCWIHLDGFPDLPKSGHIQFSFTVELNKKSTRCLTLNAAQIQQGSSNYGHVHN